MVLAGRPSKIIAWRLGISRRTIENHRASIMRKTGSKSLPALARFAIAAAWNGANERAVETGDDADTGSGWNSGARQMA
jgi:two-component system CheB/CheR fusion protein